MWTIRQAQWAAFEEVARLRVVREIARHLVHAWPDRATRLRSTAELEALVSSALGQATDLGLSSFDALKTFAECRLVFGEPPWRAPFDRCLCDPCIPAPLRVGRFVAGAQDALRGAREAHGRV